MLHWVSLFVEGGGVKPVSVYHRKLEYTPFGMCVTTIGQVVVCDPQNDRLYKYNGDGECLGHIQLGSVVRPWYITQSMASGDYIISCFCQITWIREDGTTSRRVQGAVSPGLQLNILEDLILDSDGHVLVADAAGHQVLVFDQHGHCTGQLLSDQDGIRKPARLLLDQQTDTLYVACRYPTSVRIYCYSTLLAALKSASEAHRQTKLKQSVGNNPSTIIFC